MIFWKQSNWSFSSRDSHSGKLGAWSFFENNGIQGRLKILKAETIYEKHSHPLNKILVKGDEIYITNREGYLNCIEIQLPNKKRMSSKTLLNGYKFDSNARVL